MLHIDRTFWGRSSYLIFIGSRTTLNIVRRGKKKIVLKKSEKLYSEIVEMGLILKDIN